MKKIILAASLLTGLSTATSAQSNALKVNIFSPLMRTGSFFYERQVGEHRSAQLGALFMAWSANNTKITGFALTPEYRFYLSDSKPALQGFYLGPFLRYQNLALTATEEYYGPDRSYITKSKASLNTLGGGVVAGYQFLFKKRFTLDAFLGPSYNGGSLKVKTGSTEESFDADAFAGFGLRTGVTFGVAF